MRECRGWEKAAFEVGDNRGAAQQLRTISPHAALVYTYTYACGDYLLAILLCLSSFLRPKSDSA